MSVRTKILVAFLLSLVASSLLVAQEKPLASTPPMGWNSWNKLGCNVSEDLIRQMADAMVKSGMKDAGYQYTVIDDCWQVDAMRAPTSCPMPSIFLRGSSRHLGVVDILDLQDGVGGYAGPGHWNDPDMLEVGNGGMTTDEYRAHFSRWSILSAPLIAGNDLRDMKPEIHDILTNKEVIAVNPDPLGREGRRVLKDGDLEVWAKPMQDGSRTVVLLNRAVTEKEIGFSWENLGYPSHLSAGVRDLWQAIQFLPERPTDSPRCVVWRHSAIFNSPSNHSRWRNHG